MKKSTAPLVKTIVTVFAIGSTDSNTVDTNIIVEPSAADANFSITSSPFDTNTSTTTWARLTNNPIISYLPYGDYMYKIYSNKYGLGSVKFSITSDETKNVSLLLTK
ncbi:MAG: hypothetical protein NTY48_00830 [Candidatus Diapherotrites archaeon]|nr:hypothetical protein [Candidatus Diapherotrites archaeon]